MPRVSRWLVQASLLHLVVGFSLGAMLLYNKGDPIHAGMWRLLPLHVETSLIGWLLQLTMGVAYWIFPRFGLIPVERGGERLAWLSFWLLNGGVWLVGLAALAAWSPSVSVLGRGCEAVAAVFMITNIWARTRRSGLSPM